MQRRTRATEWQAHRGVMGGALGKRRPTHRTDSDVNLKALSGLNRTDGFVRTLG
jgi:hypothetical protein